MEGYSTMSEIGRRLAEYVELCARHRIEKYRANVVPGHKDPARLLLQIQERFAAMSESERGAAVDLQSGGGHREWDRWLVGHLNQYPGDAGQLYLLRRDFEGSTPAGDSLTIPHHVYELYGGGNYPWKMDHAY
jgi:hypothetical protein